MGAFSGKLVGGAFFLLLSVAALTSTVSLLEVPVSYFVDEHKWTRPRATSFMALVVFLLGLPSMLSQGAVSFLSPPNFMRFEGKDQSFLDLISGLFLDVGLPLGGFLMCIFIARQWSTHHLAEEIIDGNPNFVGSAMQKFLNLMITVVCPVVLGIIVLITVLQKFAGVQVF